VNSSIESLHRTLEQVYVDIPKRVVVPKANKALSHLANLALGPIYAQIASQNKLPGLEFHSAARSLLRTWLLQNLNSPAKNDLLRQLVSPVVLTRFQEFEFAWQHLPGKFTNYLDISSPMIFPIRVIAEHTDVQALLVNPDKSDLPQTQQLIKAGGLGSRCSTSLSLVNDLMGMDESFDLITSLSVIEHIPDNKPAIEKIWRLLKPGGTLLITVPCSAQAYELHTNFDHYGLLDEHSSKYKFLEYLYDDALLQSFIFDVTDVPSSIEIWGEIQPGFLRKELVNRWTGHLVNYWEEPLKMGRAFKKFSRISELPGEGVACMAFVK